MSKFNYKKAEADLHDAGARHPEEIYEYKSEKAIRSFMKENGLKPEKYYSTNNSKHNSGSNSGAGQNNSGACYLTTACIVAKGLPDQCEELQVLRTFRDDYLSRIPGGYKEIDQYYTIAPKVVSEINKRTNATEIWNQLYSDLIVPCVHMIKNEQNEYAYQLYKAYSIDLYKKYVTSCI